MGGESGGNEWVGGKVGDEEEWRGCLGVGEENEVFLGEMCVEVGGDGENGV